MLVVMPGTRVVRSAGVQEPSSAWMRWWMPAGFPSRSQAVEVAIQEKLERVDRTRLARECAKLDSAFERDLAEEGLGQELGERPGY